MCNGDSIEVHGCDRRAVNYARECGSVLSLTAIVSIVSAIARHSLYLEDLRGISRPASCRFLSRRVSGSHRFPDPRGIAGIFRFRLKNVIGTGRRTKLLLIENSK